MALINDQFVGAAAAEKNRYDMEIRLLEMSIGRCSEYIQELIGFQTTVYAKFRDTDRLRYQCQFNNMRRLIDAKCNELRLLEIKHEDKERKRRWLKREIRSAKKSHRKGRGGGNVVALDQWCGSTSLLNGSSDESGASTSSADSSLDGMSSNGSFLDRNQVLTFDDSGLESPVGPVLPSVNDGQMSELEMLGLDLSSSSEEDTSAEASGGIGSFSFVEWD